MLIKEFKNEMISKKNRKRFNRCLYYIEYSMHIICEIDDFNDEEMMKINAIKNFRKSFEFMLEFLSKEEFNALKKAREDFSIAHSFYERLIEN